MLIPRYFVNLIQEAQTGGDYEECKEKNPSSRSSCQGNNGGRTLSQKKEGAERRSYFFGENVPKISLSGQVVE